MQIEPVISFGRRGFCYGEAFGGRCSSCVSMTAAVDIESKYLVGQQAFGWIDGKQIPTWPVHHSCSNREFSD